MPSRFPNLFRMVILYIGLALSRAGLIERRRVVRTTDLAWPRIVTGIARMSKNAVDIAMVGAAVGTSAVAGVGFAGAYWGLAFAIGEGIAGGAIALVSQRYGAEAYDDLSNTVRTSVLLVVLITLPVAVIFWLFSTSLVGLLSSNEQAVALGGDYLRIIGLGVPFITLSILGSRVLVGCDDAYTAMQVRTGGAVANVFFSAFFIFVMKWGVEGAALGTLISITFVAAAFVLGFAFGQLPGLGDFPVVIDPFGSYVDLKVARHLVEIGLPVGARTLVWTIAEFPMLFILDVFGESTVAAFVIARRIWGIMNTPGWGFGLASSSLVGQELGKRNPTEAEAYANDIIKFSVVTYAISAVLVFIFATDIVLLFANNPSSSEVPTAVNLVYIACIAIIFKGISGGAAGPLDTAGDTKVPFLSQFIAMFCVSIPLVYVGAHNSTPTIDLPVIDVVVPEVALPAIGLWGLYISFMTESIIPAVINYWRFRSGKWKSVSEDYHPEVPGND